jgi:hypothetical protein
MTRFEHQQPKESAGIEKTVQQTIVSVVLGQESKDCDNYGVCRVDYPSHQVFRHLKQADARACCNNSLAVLSVTPKGEFELAFAKASMTPACMARFFSTDHFRVDEAFCLPDFLIKDLAVPLIIIEKGAYPLQETTGFFIVRFD